jgi:hypothetical protein
MCYGFEPRARIITLKIRGIDFEGLSHADRQAHVHQFQAALRLLDERWRVYQYLSKRIIDS